MLISNSCENLLKAANDSTAKYRELYRLEKLVSAGFKQVYEIEANKSARTNEVVAVYAETLDANDSELVKQAKRAETAEAALQPVTEERDRLKGKTVAGKFLRKARDGLAVIGGIYLIVQSIALSK